MDSFQGLHFHGGGRGDLQQPQQNPFPNSFHLQPQSYTLPTSNYSYPPPPPPPSHLHLHYPSPTPPISSQHQPPPSQQWGHPDGHLQQQHHHPPLPPPYPPTAVPPYAAQPMPHHQYPPQPPSLPASHHVLLPLSHSHRLLSPSPPPSAYPPPPHQGWGGPSWGQHQGWEYPDTHIPYNTEDDWATRAKAWAASKALTDNHQTHSQVVPDGRMEAHSSTYHDQYQAATCPPSSTLPSSLSQSTNQQFPSYSLDQQKQANHLQGSAPFSSGLTSYAADSRLHYNYGEEVAPYKDHNSPTKHLVSSSSIYEQEVSYSYSSIPVDQQDFTHGRQPSDYATDASNKPLDFEPRLSELELHPKIGYGPNPSTGVTDQDAIATSVNAWAPPIAPGIFPQTSIAESVTQPALGPHTSAVYGRISGPNFMPGVPPVNPPFGLVTSASRNQAMILPADANSPFTLSDRPKKAAVPNWLREEIIKNKSVIASTYAGNQSGNFYNSMGSEDDDKLNKKSDQADNNSVDSTKSADDEEDDAEAAKSAAINQEIKRVLTEVLLKVTDELFDEIAMKVLNEDDQTEEVPGDKENGNQKVSFPVVSTPKASANVLVKIKENMTDNGVNESSTLPSPSGNLLGLASYASDEDDDDDVGTQNSELLVHESNHRASGNAPKNVVTQSVLIDKGRSRDQDNDVSQRVELNDASKNSNAINHAAKSVPLTASQSDGKLCNHGKEHIAPQSKGKATSKCDMKSHDTSANNRSWESASTVDPVRELRNTIGSSRHPEKKSYSKDYVKKELTITDKSNSESSDETINHENKIRLKEKINKRNKQKEIIEEEIIKRGANAKDYDSRSHDSIKDKMETVKDKKKKDKVDNERNKEKLRGEDDNSRQIMKESKYNSRRSPSPCHRGRNGKESEVSKKRRLQSRSPSPTRSRNRQVSRSPHRKHSHRRHSPYSSDRRRARSSGSPPHRRR